MEDSSGAGESGTRSGRERSEHHGGRRGGGDRHRRDEPLVYDGVENIPTGVLSRYFAADAMRRAERFATECRDFEVARRALKVFHQDVCRLDDASRASDGSSLAHVRVAVSMLGAKAAYQAGRGVLGEEFAKFMQRAAKDVDSAGKLRVFRLLMEAIVGYFANYRSSRQGTPTQQHSHRGEQRRRDRKQSGGKDAKDEGAAVVAISSEDFSGGSSGAEEHSGD